MTTQPIKMTVADFKSINLSLILYHNKDYYSDKSSALSMAANKELKAGNQKTGKILSLLAACCSMMLNTTDANKPFKTMIERDNGKTSTIPDNINLDDLQFLKEILPNIDDKKLKARIADILWLKLPKKDREIALIAIDCYIAIEITVDNIYKDVGDCWDRAIQLCKQLKKTSEQKLDIIKTSLIKKLEQAKQQDYYYAIYISELLVKYKLADTTQIIKKLEELAFHFKEDGSLQHALHYFEIIANLYKKLKNNKKHTEITVIIAETLQTKAEYSQIPTNTCNISSAIFYEKALKKYLTIPNKFREIYQVDKKIHILKNKIIKANQASLNEMLQIKTDNINVTKLIKYSKDVVSNKSIDDALIIFLNTYPYEKKDLIKKYTEKFLADHPLQAIFSCNIISKDGRLVAKIPAIEHNGDSKDNEKNEKTILGHIISRYNLNISFTVHAHILPALAVIRLEHGLTIDYFENITKHSPIIPKGYKNNFAKGLFHGYNNDFTSALYILTPQIETLVRYHLKQSGVNTINKDKNGIETENGLNTLIKYKEFAMIFEHDVAFEIEALFCSSFGYNVKNNLSHGLLNDDESSSIYSIYAWWFCLKIAFNAFWNTKKTEEI